MLTQDAVIHATTPEDWERQEPSGSYVPPGFDQEGFIHCCHRGQLEQVLRDYFGAAESVLLLVLDPAGVAPQIRYELSPSTGEDYPHIYGPLNVSAVSEAIAITRDGPTWSVSADL